MCKNIEQSNDGANPVLCKGDLENRLEKNRDEIEMWLNKDSPLELVYMRIRMLTNQNEKIISQLKTI
jgi:hypothetical protein